MLQMKFFISVRVCTRLERMRNIGEELGVQTMIKIAMGKWKLGLKNYQGVILMFVRTMNEKTKEVGYR